LERLRGMGWRVLTIWECALKGKHRYEPNMLMHEISAWLRSENGPASISHAGLSLMGVGPSP
jgi:DNA mismatch endonuclease (patch repair protein)